MNNISSSHLVDILASYDRDRRYTNVAYTSGYSELPFYIRAIQATLIRLLIYSRLAGKHLKIGDYYVNPKNVICFLNQELLGDGEWVIGKESIEEIKRLLNETSENQEDRYTLEFVVFKILDFMESNPSGFQNVWEGSSQVRHILKKDIGSLRLPKSQVEDVLANVETEISFGKLFINLLDKMSRINMEDVQDIVADTEGYYEIWDQITLENISKILKNK